MEMTGTCFAERTTDNDQKGSSLYVRWKEKEWKAENNISLSQCHTSERPDVNKKGMNASSILNHKNVLLNQNSPPTEEK